MLIKIFNIIIHLEKKILKPFKKYDGMYKLYKVMLNSKNWFYLNSHIYSQSNSEKDVHELWLQSSIGNLFLLILRCLKYFSKHTYYFKIIMMSFVKNEYSHLASQFKIPNIKSLFCVIYFFLVMSLYWCLKFL